MIKLKVNGEEVKFKTTIFPDGSSQIWQHDFEFQQKYNYINITFLWENNEAEIIHLCQIVDLIREEDKEAYINLYMPYLPFARQDRSIRNTETFALHSFAKILNNLNCSSVTSFDVHSNKANKLINNFESISPENFHHSVITKYNPDYIFYPDEGAIDRYPRLGNNFLLGKKVRNQLTGEIDSYELVNKSNLELKGKKVLIVDDLMDRGGTFILAVKELKKLETKDVALCISHALFSNGKEEMIEAGISEFFTTNSLLKNKEGYSVW